MQQREKKIKQHFSPVCVFKKKEFDEKISMNNYSLLQYFDLLMRT